MLTHESNLRDTKAKLFWAVYDIFTAAADSAEVVIMLKSNGLVRLFVARFRHFYKSISRPLIGRKYHLHWGRGR